MTEEEKVLQLEKEAQEALEKNETKTYTEEELQAQIQSTTDKRVSQALKTAQDKWESEFKAKLEAEKSEAEKLGAMTADERAKAEFEAERAQFEEDRKTYQREKLELATVKELSASNLPTEFSGYVLADSADEIKSNIETFKTQWQTAIETAVNERLKGKTPKAQTGAITSITKEQFNKMGYKERAKLIEEDPALYEALKG